MELCADPQKKLGYSVTGELLGSPSTQAPRCPTVSAPVTSSPSESAETTCEDAARRCESPLLGQQHKKSAMESGAE